MAGKQKSGKKSKRGQAKRERYRTSRPDLVRSVKNLARSSGIDAAKAYVNGKLFVPGWERDSKTGKLVRRRSISGARAKRTDDVTSSKKVTRLRKVLDKEKDRWETRKLRKAERSADPSVRKRLANRRVQFLRGKLHELNAVKKERQRLEKASADSLHSSSAIAAALVRLPTFEEIGAQRRAVIKNLERAEVRLAKAS